MYFIDYAIIVVSCFSPLYSLPPCTPPSYQQPPTLLHVHGSYICSLASPFPILFLTSPCLFCTYQLCFFFPVPFPQFSLLPLPNDNPPCDLHFCDSVPVLVICLVYFCFQVQLLIVVSSHFTVHSFDLLFLFLFFFFYLFYCCSVVFFFLNKTL